MISDSAIQTRLASALATWARWPMALAREPIAVRPLNAGTTNTSFIIQEKDSEQQYRLRLNNASSAILGIDRHHEITIVKALQEHALTPKLIHSDLELNFSIFDYVTGRTWALNDYKNTDQLQHLFGLIQKFQTLKIQLPSRDYVTYLNNYLRHLEWLSPTLSGALSIQIANFLKELEEFMAANWKPVLSHHDLIPENILETEKGLMILDWEYAALGHPELDQRYITHCQNQSFEKKQDSLIQGDTLDRLLYWVYILWTEVNKLQAENAR